MYCSWPYTQSIFHSITEKPAYSYHCCSIHKSMKLERKTRRPTVTEWIQKSDVLTQWNITWLLKMKFTDSYTVLEKKTLDPKEK